MAPVREKSTAVAAAKPTAVSSKGEYVITKLDDLINWARRVSGCQYFKCMKTKLVRKTINFYLKEGFKCKLKAEWVNGLLIFGLVYFNILSQYIFKRL